MTAFLSQTLMIFPLVFLRALPTYVIGGVYFWLAFSVNDDVFLRWFFGLIAIFAGLPLAALMILRGALVQLKQTEATALDRIARGGVRLGAFQGFIWLLIALVFLIPCGLAFYYLVGLPKVTDAAFTLEAIGEVLIVGQMDRLDPRYAMIFVLISIPTALAGSFIAIAMAGTAATVVSRPPLIDSIWGIGRRVGALAVLFVPSALVFFALAFMLTIGGLIPLVADLTRSQIIGVVSPLLVALSLWLPLFAAAGAVGFKECRARDAQERAAIIGAGAQGRAAPDDIRALRAGRQRDSGN